MKYLIRFISTSLPFIFVFLATLYHPLDPDLGWHIRYGEYFFRYWHPLRENLYAAEMMDFRWANISWGADLFYYLAYNWGGFLGLTLLSSLIITLTFYFFSRAFRLDYWEKAFVFPIILFFQDPVHVNSFRAQLLSMLMLSILFFLITQFERHRGKSLYVTPLIFMLWANLHGLFLLGLGLFILWEGFFLISLAWPKRSILPLLPYVKPFGLITLLSFLVTIIHPFGLGIYQDALVHVSNPLLKAVAEYNPVREMSQQWYHLLFIIVLVTIGIIAKVINRTFYEKIPYLGIFAILYSLSLNVKRYSWVMYYMAIPFIKPLATIFRPVTKTGVFRGATALFIIYIAFICLLKYPFTQYASFTWKDYCQPLLHCSDNAMKTLHTYYQTGKTMTPYSWGGWIIYNYPALKPSTDGRMHLWRDEKGYSGFEYDHFLEYAINDINRSKYNVVLAAKQKPIFNRLRTLTKQGEWRIVYNDPASAIFIRNTKSSLP